MLFPRHGSIGKFRRGCRNEFRRVDVARPGQKTHVGRKARSLQHVFDRLEGGFADIDDEWPCHVTGFAGASVSAGVGPTSVVAAFAAAGFVAGFPCACRAAAFSGTGCVAAITGSVTRYFAGVARAGAVAASVAGAVAALRRTGRAAGAAETGVFRAGFDGSRYVAQRTPGQDTQYIFRRQCAKPFFFPLLEALKFR